MSGVYIESPDPHAAEALTELWLALARGQREHDSHLLAEPNRNRIRDLFARYGVTDRLLVARSDDTSSGDVETDIVGFVMFRECADNYEVDCERGLVENLYVVPGRRGEGIGSDLLAAAERQLREQGVETISLEAMAQNHAARRFYRRQGYRPHRIEFEKSLEEGD